MTASVGVVACSTLYAELDTIDRSIEGRFVPQELHETPIDPGDRETAHERVQTAVDELSELVTDRIAVAYARSEGELADITARRVPLVVWRVADCIDGVRARSAKDPRTFYLTRGWIDRGIDPYKLYLAYTGEVSSLVAWFDRETEAHDDVEVTWQTGERFRRAVEQGTKGTTAPVDAHFRHQLSFFNSVELIDTGTLHPFHRRYAERFAAFLEDLQITEGNPPPVDVRVRSGDLTLLETMLQGGTPSPESFGRLIEAINLVEPGASIPAFDRR